MSGEAFNVDQSKDETPALDEATFDLNGWIKGVQPTIRSVKLYGRADLLAEIDDLERRVKLAVSAGAPEGEEGLEDDSAAGLQRQLEELYAQFSASAVTFRVQGRSDEWREWRDKHLKREGVKDASERTLRLLADSIVSPAGVTHEHLKHLQDVSEAQIKLLLVAWGTANHTPPRVDVPFSRASSAKPGGRASS